MPKKKQGPSFNLTLPRYLLPLMLFVGILIVGIRTGDVWESLASGKMFNGPASATAAESKSDAAATTPATAAPATETPATTADKPAAAAAAADTAALKTQEPPSDDSDVSPAEVEVLKQLSDRRVQLDKRAKDLDTREALMKVTEQRVDQKIKEMEQLRQQLQTMVNQVDETQAQQIDNLVKIYETMKPEDAAHIFETLDMPVLLSVIQKMKPKNTAPIMAKMNPQKAKDLTIALTKQDQLPAIK